MSFWMSVLAICLVVEVVALILALRREWQGKGKDLYSWQDTAIEFVPISILDPSEDSPRCDSLVAQQGKEVLLGIYSW